MSFKRRAIAFILTCCMVFTMFPMYALADDIRNYKTLDEIPEDVNVFRSIRTGNISPRWLAGELYYQFTQDGYPTVRIKASAFMNQPNNNYLDADNAALSVNCQNDDGTSRVCYYKEMDYEKSPYDGSSIYTFSMYRLELSAKVDKREGVLDVGAKLTSGVTFYYTPSAMPAYALQRRSNKLPLRASVGADSYCVSQDVSLLSYIAKVNGIASEISDASKLELGSSTVGCAASVLSLIAALDPEGFSKMALAAAAFGTASSCPTPIIAVFKQNTVSPMETESAVYRCGAPVVVPAKLAYSENMMTTTFKLNCRNFSKDDTRFMIVFSFTTK